jgi:hypothetical protein
LPLKALVVHEEQNAALVVVLVVAARQHVGRQSLKYTLSRGLLLLEHQSEDLCDTVHLEAVLVGGPDEVFTSDRKVLLQNNHDVLH